MSSPSHGLRLGAMACASGHAWAWAKVQLNHQRPKVMTISLAPDPIATFAWPGVEQPLKHRTTKRRNQRNNERANEKKRLTCSQHPRFLHNGSAAVRRTSMAGPLLLAYQELDTHNSHVLRPARFQHVATLRNNGTKPQSANT